MCLQNPAGKAIIHKMKTIAPNSLCKLIHSYVSISSQLLLQYSTFIEYLDKRADPTKQAQSTINYLFKIADSLDIDVSEVFEHLSGNDVIQMLHRRQLSPWILINSPKFKQFLIHRVTDEERITMTAIIRPPLWAEKKANHPEIIAQMKKYVQELNL